jgi:hypothetical protein
MFSSKEMQTNYYSYVYKNIQYKFKVWNSLFMYSDRSNKTDTLV